MKISVIVPTLDEARRLPASLGCPDFAGPEVEVIVSDGGSGDDTVSFRGAARGVEVDLRTGQASGQGADELARIEHVIGTAHPDVLIGNAERNRLEGRGGADVLRGKDGADQLFGGGSGDLLSGGGGPDRITPNSGDDTIIGGTGAEDWLILSDAERSLDVDLRGLPDAKVRGPVRHRQMTRWVSGKLFQTGMPQKWLPSVQRGRATPERTKQGGPMWRVRPGCTAPTCSISSIDARQISRCALRQVRIVHLWSRSSRVPDSSKRTASAFGST